MANFEKYGFGKRLLESRGWTSGKGLGRNESGITEALKPSLKFDKAGVGHNPADDISFNWWDHVYKKAASNIVVEHSEDGVELKQIEDHADLISTKKWKLKKKKSGKQSSLDKKPLKYGVFVKSSVLTKDGEMKDDQIEPSADDVDDDDLPHRTEVDETLLKACEGRTAHKGARHGLTASGKLMRLEAQENGTSTSETSVGLKVKTRKRKAGIIQNGTAITTEGDNWERKGKRKFTECNNHELVESKKSGNEEKRQTIDQNGHAETSEFSTHTVGLTQNHLLSENSGENFHKKKKNKKKKHKQRSKDKIN